MDVSPTSGIPMPALFSSQEEVTESYLGYQDERARKLPKFDSPDASQVDEADSQQCGDHVPPLQAHQSTYNVCPVLLSENRTWYCSEFNLVAISHKDHKKPTNWLLPPDANLPTLQLMQAEPSEWPFFFVKPEKKSPIPSDQIRLTLEAHDPVEGFFSLSEIPGERGNPYWFRNPFPFGTWGEGQEKWTFTILVELPGRSWRTDYFQALKRAHFIRLRKKINETGDGGLEYKRFFEKIQSTAEHDVESAKEIISAACDHWTNDEKYQAIGAEYLVKICRFAVYRNAVKHGNDVAERLSFPIMQRKGHSAKTKGDLCLLLGKNLRRLGELKTARDCYNQGLEAVGDDDSLFELKCDLTNSLAQVLYQIEDKREECLGMIQACLADERTAQPSYNWLTSKLLIAQARFLPKEDVQKKIEKLDKSLELKHHVSTEVRKWKLEAHDLDASISKVNSYIEQLSKNHFEACRLRWRLIVLFCRKHDRQEVLNRLVQIVEMFKNAYMYLERSKARALLESMKSRSPSGLDQLDSCQYFQELALSRRYRVKDHLNNLRLMVP